MDSVLIGSPQDMKGGHEFPTCSSRDPRLVQEANKSIRLYTFLPPEPFEKVPNRVLPESRASNEGNSGSRKTYWEPSFDVEV